MENSTKYIDIDIINEYLIKFLSDGKLRTEDGCVFDIHKFVLAKGSKYFTAMFCGTKKDKKDFLIPGIKGDIMNIILSFIYSGSVSVKDENVGELMIAADYLLLDDLLSHMIILLKKIITIENCLSFYIAAQKINRRNILRLCYRFVETHFETVLNSNNEEFSKLSLDSLKQFLSDRNLCVSSENTVFLAIVKWVMADKLNRQRFVFDLLKCLSTEELNEDLAAAILEADIVVNNPFCQDVLDAKHIFPKADYVEILERCLRDPAKPSIGNFIPRLPTELHCIAHYRACEGRYFVQFYATFDENIDLWRKIVEIELSPKFFTFIDDCIFMLKGSNDKNFRYCITEKQVYELDDFINPRHNYAVVTVQGKIYILGGTSDITGEELYDVEIYNSDLGLWYSTEPMIPISAYSAVSLYEYIYVVGYKVNIENREMIAQVYNTISETWNLLPAVSVGRSHFALVAYHGKVYVLGGIHDEEYLTDVEMFDPIKNDWETKPNLPYAYYVPKALVLLDLLIVYDNHIEDRTYMKTNPPVLWNSEKESWERFKELSPMTKLHFYQFMTLDKRESIAALTAENRKYSTCFEECPFA